MLHRERHPLDGCRGRGSLRRGGQHGAAVTLPTAPSAPGEDTISSTFDIALMLDSMEFNDESTWPADVLEYLGKHHSLLLAWAKRGEGPMPCPVMPEHYDRTLNGLRRVLNNHALHGYHCTRLTKAEIEHIKSNGMQLPNGAMLKRRIEALEAAGLNLHRNRARLRHGELRR